MNVVQPKIRDFRYDILRGLAIIAIVLYHFCANWVPFGYYGVEVFLVIAGYFMMKSILKSVKNDQFSPIKYVVARVARTLPMVLVASAIAFIVGIFLMLPDDFENLSQSIIASTFFVNNVLAAITTKNYWDVVNIYKPLMHTWYLGVLMQIYVVMAIAVWLCVKIFKKNKVKALFYMTAGITALSLVLYLMPFSQELKFYMFPFRFFEITAGALVAFFNVKQQDSSKKKDRAVAVTEIACIVMLLFIMFVPINFSTTIKLLLSVACTVALVICFQTKNAKNIKLFRPFAVLGEYSFSIYVCHQVVVAFTFYSFVPTATIGSLVIYFLITALISFATYHVVEKKDFFLRGKMKTVGCIALAGVVTLSSIFVYMKAGVIKDVPELGVTVQNAERGMHAAYCDIPYGWTKPFTDDNKVNVTVIGDSFGRDWANILNESEISDKVEIFYVYPYSTQYIQERIPQILQSDYVFASVSGEQADLNEYIPNEIPQEKLYVIGYKNFGTSNGIIYSKRFSANYFEQTVTLSDEALLHNEWMKAKYGTRFIDMIAPVLVGEKNVRVFTDDNKFISQDCRHLTKFGAKYYAKVLDLNWIIN